jgi:hypothetical protein
LNEHRFFAGISPRTGAFLFAGWTFSVSGEREWWGPLVEERGPDGKVIGRYYDWRAELALQPSINRNARAAITHAEYLSDGRVFLGAPAVAGSSVLERSPVDITVPARRSMALAAMEPELMRYKFGLGWRKALPCSVAAFDPSSPRNCAYGYWLGMEKHPGRKASMTLDGVRAPDLRHIALWGVCASDLLTTVDPVPVGSNAVTVAKMRRKPAVPYLAVFASQGPNVLWSSWLPRCRVKGAAACPRGLVVVSACRARWRLERYEMPAAPGVQPEFGGGYADGHILLLESPK